MADLSRDDIQKIALEHLRKSLQQAEQQEATSARMSPEAVDGQVCTLDKQSEFVREELQQNDYQRIQDYLPFQLKQIGVEVPEDSPTFSLLCREFLKVELKEYEIRQRWAQGDFDFGQEYLQGPSNNNLAPQLPPPTVSAQVQPKPTEPLLSLVIAEYIADKKRDKAWKPRTETNIVATLNLFVEAIGDPPINEISREAVREFRDLIKNHYPSNWKKKKQYRDKSLKELMRAPIPERDHISNVRIKFYFDTVSSFLGWAKDQGYGVDDGFTRILSQKITRQPHEQRDFFTPENLETMFHSSAFVEDKHRKSYQFWAPVIGLFTGMRLEEICQLELEDIRQEDGVWVFDVNKEGDKDTKSAAGERLVPIHNFLVDDLGLLAYRDKLKRLRKRRLLYELNKTKSGVYHKSVSDWFNQRFLKGLGLKEQGKLDFHSFRHTLVNHCKLLDIEEGKVKQLVGHKGTESITYGRYGKPYPVEMLKKDVVDRLDYGVDLSHLRRSRWIR